MINKKSISTLVVAFLVFSFLLLALPEKGISSIPKGCCIKDTLCVGCVSDCATSESFCIKEGGEVNEMEGICINEEGEASCDGSVDTGEGCCVLGPDNCVEDISSRECFDTLHGDIWNLVESCSEVPECAPLVTNVPTLSQWGLIAMAGILGIIGFLIIRRRKVSA